MGLSAYTMILAADGTEKRAENIVPGDMVKNPFTGKDQAVRKVWQGPAVGMFRIAADDGGTLDLNEDHAVLTGGGLMKAAQIQAGTVLRTAAGTARCVEATRLLGDFMVYDVVLEDDGSQPGLIANGYCVGS